MSFQRLIYMADAANFSGACQFLGDLYGQPAAGQMNMNASLSGSEPKTHSVGAAYFNEEQLPQVIDWFSNHSGCGVVYANSEDYAWGVAFNNWGLKYVEDPL